MSCVATARGFVSRVFDQQECSLERFVAAFNDCLQGLKHDNMRAYFLTLCWAYLQPKKGKELTVNTLTEAYNGICDLFQEQGESAAACHLTEAFLEKQKTAPTIEVLLNTYRTAYHLLQRKNHV